MSTLRSFYRDTRALSPVVATILLVAIAVIASVLTYLWATGFIGAIQTRPNQTTETIHAQAASYSVASGGISLYLTNAGTQQVTMTDIFILNTSGSVLGHVAAGGTTTINAGTTQQITGTIAAGPAGITVGMQIILQGVSSKGTATEITVTASS